MKRNTGNVLAMIACLAICLVIIVMAQSSQLRAAATVSADTITDYQGFSVHEFTYTMSTSGTATTTTAIKGRVIAVETNPGSPAPTDNYDLTINDANGADIMGGALQNRDTSTTEMAIPLVGALAAPQGIPVDSVLSIVSSGNSQSGATVLLRIFVIDEKKGRLSW